MTHNTNTLNVVYTSRSTFRKTADAEASTANPAPDAVSSVKQPAAVKPSAEEEDTRVQDCMKKYERIIATRVSNKTNYTARNEKLSDLRKDKAAMKKLQDKRSNRYREAKKIVKQSGELVVMLSCIIIIVLLLLCSFFCIYRFPPSDAPPLNWLEPGDSVPPMKGDDCPILAEALKNVYKCAAELKEKDAEFRGKTCQHGMDWIRQYVERLHAAVLVVEELRPGSKFTADYLRWIRPANLDVRVPMIKAGPDALSGVDLPHATKLKSKSGRKSVQAALHAMGFNLGDEFVMWATPEICKRLKLPRVHKVSTSYIHFESNTIELSLFLYDTPRRMRVISLPLQDIPFSFRMACLLPFLWECLGPIMWHCQGNGRSRS